MIVVDASAVVELLLRGLRAAEIADRVTRSGESLHAPHLLDLEIAQVLRRLRSSGKLSLARSEGALMDYSRLRIERYPHRHLLSRIWELRDNVTAYDAAYLGLAETLEAPLLTRDRRMANAPGIRATVEVV